MSHLTTPRTQSLPAPVSATAHASMPEPPAPAPLHYKPNWHFSTGATTTELKHVTCRACLEAIQTELDVTCHHKTSNNTWFEPGEYCETIALPTSEYCFEHAATHGEHTALHQWEDAI